MDFLDYTEMFIDIFSYFFGKKFYLTCACGSRNKFKKVLSGKSKRKIEGARPQKFKFWIIQCKACGLHQTYPRPYETSSESIYYQEKKDVESRIRDIENIRRYASLILERIQPYKKAGKWVDLGASIGVLVHAAQKNGFQATGIELNSYAIQKAKELFSVNLIQGDMFGQHFLDESVDVFTLSQTLEHIENPSHILKILYRRLKKEGLLYLDVPNFESVMADFLKEKWGFLDPYRHLWQFTPKTLKTLLQNSGFKKINFILNENNNYMYELNHFRGAQKKQLEEKLALGVQTNRGDVLICIAQK